MACVARSRDENLAVELEAAVRVAQDQAQLTGSVETLTRTTDARLEQIQGKVSERLEEGFRKTNETFANVMARLATIDEAQRKIDSLTTNVVSLQELLGDKRSRGAFGALPARATGRSSSRSRQSAASAT